jgi:hypothetical protein
MSLNHGVVGASPIDRAALVKYFGPPGTIDAPNPVFLFDDSDLVKLENLSVDCRDVPLTVGFSLGNAGSGAQSKYFTGINVDAAHCAIGMRIGTGLTPGDDAANSFDSSIFDSNSWAGLIVDSGDALVHFTNLSATNNGTAPPGAPCSGFSGVGANVFLNAGELTLDAYESAGGALTSTGVPTPRPRTADIYMADGGLKVNGAWSDTHGPFLIGVGVSESAYVSGVRHHEGSMAKAGDTPFSIRWGAAQPLVLSGSYLFNSVTIASGHNTHVIDLGTRFISDGATFVADPGTDCLGPGADSLALGAYVGLGTQHDMLGATQSAVASFGRPVPASWNFTPQIAEFASDGRSGVAHALLDGSQVVTEYMSQASGARHWVDNAYHDSAGLHPILAGPVWDLSASVESFPVSAESSARLDLSAGTGTASTTATTTSVFSAGKYDMGWGTAYGVSAGPNTEVWASAPPSSASTHAWQFGDLVHNTKITSGLTMGWIFADCGAAGGCWKAMPNLP